MADTGKRFSFLRKATPYLPVIDLIKTYCQIEARNDGRKIREKLTGKLLTLDRALEPTLPALLALLDVPVDDPQWRDLDPPQRRQRTLDRKTSTTQGESGTAYAVGFRRPPLDRL